LQNCNKYFRCRCWTITRWRHHRRMTFTSSWVQFSSHEERSASDTWSLALSYCRFCLKFHLNFIAVASYYIRIYNYSYNNNNRLLVFTGSLFSNDINNVLCQMTGWILAITSASTIPVHCSSTRLVRLASFNVVPELITMPASFATAASHIASRALTAHISTPLPRPAPTGETPSSETEIKPLPRAGKSQECTNTSTDVWTWNFRIYERHCFFEISSNRV